MPSRRIAHLSDLHIGAASQRASERLVQAVLRSGADRVAITGDATHRGRAAELERFRHVRSAARGRQGGQGFRVFDVDGRRVDTCWIDGDLKW